MLYEVITVMLYSTNGLNPERIAETTGRVLADCRRSTVVVKVSLDAVGEAHDRLRGVPGGFERAVRTYRLLARLLDRYPVITSYSIHYTKLYDESTNTRPLPIT